MLKWLPYESKFQLKELCIYIFEREKHNLVSSLVKEKHIQSRRIKKFKINNTVI